MEVFKKHIDMALQDMVS